MSTQRVVVAVSPRLLADALCQALARDGLEVINADAGPLPDGEYDVAVVNGGRGAEVRARYVVTLPEEGSGPGGLSSLALLREALADLR